jgi:hypothetical protein
MKNLYRILIVLFLAIILAVPPIASAKSRSYHSSSHYSKGSSSHSYRSHSYGHKSNYTYGVRRDKHGHIARSSKAKGEFMRRHPCPSTGKTYGACPGYVVDHITPLKHGGSDSSSNMQWQTKAAAKSKDKYE